MLMGHSAEQMLAHSRCLHAALQSAVQPAARPLHKVGNRPIGNADLQACAVMAPSGFMYVHCSELCSCTTLGSSCA